MRRNLPFRLMLLLIILAGLLAPVSRVQAAGVSAGDLISAMNSLRVSYGHKALIVDSIIMSVAQSTAQIMAANLMSSHIGNVRGRLASAGYGGGATVWATENFAVGGSLTIDQIMQIWSDPDHMLPAVNVAYCNVGAGVAKASNGMTYYVLQAAYTESKSCGSYTSSGSSSGSSGGQPSVSQVIIPVKVATPGSDGRIIHVVEAGQSFWAIAIAYKVTIADIKFWNNLPENASLQIGMKLFIPGPNTAGYSTPTPVGMVVTSTPGPSGKIVHVVQPYQTLTTIAAAYKVKIDTILALNYIQIDWPLQIGQKLVIYPGNITPSPTPRPLTPIEKLTPDSDGKYYHTVKSGETLYYIANLYKIALADLMGWNGLNSSSIIVPGQKLLLQVTPPPTATFTPAPATATPTASLTASPSATLKPVTPSATPLPPLPAASPTATPEPFPAGGASPAVSVVTIGLAVVGLLLVAYFSRRRH